MPSLEEKIRMEGRIVDTNIESYEDLASPEHIVNEIPITDKATKTVFETRQAIRDIMDRKDPRKIIIVGPCSISDVNSGLEYARKLKTLADEFKDEILIVMRTYLEKPRTTIGWKGLLYDPDLDDSNNVEKGVKIGRKFLLDVNNLGLGCANEFVRTDFPQYIADLVSWSAVGARSVEYPGCRELTSGLSMPVGFKNSTAGDIEAAVNACKTSTYSHRFPGLLMNGKTAIVKSKGNKYVHVVLRGGNGQPNYHPEKVDETVNLMKKSGLTPNIIVDCSHANSNKHYEKQEQVAYDVLAQMKENGDIVGIMLESNLFEGNQPFPKNAEERKNIKYGISLTDSCIPLDITERIIRTYAQEIKNRNPNKD